MVEQFIVRRIRVRTEYRTAPNGRLITTKLEQWVTGKGKTLEEALQNFEIHKHKRYETPPRSYSFKPFTAWGMRYINGRSGTVGQRPRKEDEVGKFIRFNDPFLQERLEQDKRSQTNAGKTRRTT